MTNDLKSHIAKLDIQELRLVNGDHIIAEVLWDKDSDDIVIKDPMLLGIGETGGRIFTEWFAYTDDQYFSIDKSSIIASGSASFDSKVFFCRLVLTRNIKTNLLSGNPQSDEDVSMLKEIAFIMQGEQDLIVTPDENDDADELIDELYAGWQNDVDKNTVH